MGGGEIVTTVPTINSHIFEVRDPMYTLGQVPDSPDIASLLLNHLDSP